MAVGVGRVLRFGATLTDNDAVACDLCRKLRPRIPQLSHHYTLTPPPKTTLTHPRTIVGMGKQIPANISLAY
jgi:hypothetical protein